MRDAWRLSVGTFTALPTQPPSPGRCPHVGQGDAARPVTAAPAAAAWVGLALLTTHALLPYAVAAVLALVVTALLSRALHLDGLADLADGLTSGHDRERSLEVMRRGNTGPAGAAALVLVLGLDAACLAALLTDARGAAPGRDGARGEPGGTRDLRASTAYRLLVRRVWVTEWRAP